MDNCIFCKITAGEIPAAKIWEDNDFLAVLDVNPNTKGMALVLPKTHYDSYAFDMPDDVYSRFLNAAKTVGKILEKGLAVQRVAMVIEGMGVNHAHIKLYPLHGLTEKFQEMWAHERVYFETYQGYLSTQLGPQADIEELNKLADEIKRNAEI
ncbi:HIT domain-containing protein [Candidatus Uhrbacteria bacterium]|nr:HIT domain-containing protein [Candidatus Uhrbacteria bacterium]